jgi:hypothetical protein
MAHDRSQNARQNSDGFELRPSSNSGLPPEYFHPVPIYVPTKPWTGQPFGIVPGSAIVGPLAPDDPSRTLTVYYEGNIYGGSYFSRFATRCLHAHGRMAQRYPTVARARVPIEGLTQVGLWHPREKVVELIDLNLLAEWCGWTLPVNSEELHAK